MARNMSYKAIEKEVLHNSNKDCFATYGFGEPVHIHDNTTEHQGMRATLCQCAYIKPPTACLSLQEFQPTQKTPPQSSPCLLQGPRVREEEKCQTVCVGTLKALAHHLILRSTYQNGRFISAASLGIRLRPSR